LFLRIPSGAISAHDFSKATAVARQSLMTSALGLAHK
jgi:hypothetical protein